ncbi:CAP domain-containing protein [Plantactinospora sp. B24E8]|uniref:CAP domain-containing protein n=1 Tax=Plantactinospora sp. B24E8 TaxID=3153567 RepID=UPI00325D0A5E
MTGAVWEAWNVHGWNDPIDRDEDAGWPGPPDQGHPSSWEEHPPSRAGQPSSRGEHPAELGFFELGPEWDDDVPSRRVRAGATAEPTRSRPDSRSTDRRRPGGARTGSRNSGRGGGRNGDGADNRHSGRHRRQGGLRGPIGLGLAVTALLGLLGVGAALLPPALTSAPRVGAEQPAPDTAVEPSDGTTVPETSPTGVDAETTTPSPVPSTTRPSPKPRATPSTTRPRTTSPTPRRTATKTPTRANPGADSREAQVLEIVNRERTANGCDPVVMNSQLAEAARLHSQDQGEHTNMSHTGSDGSDFVERAREAGYASPIGENVAMGYPTAAAVMDGWMNSSGHRANILNCDAKAMGVGVATGADGRLYWTQVFGSTA